MHSLSDKTLKTCHVFIPAEFKPLTTRYPCLSFFEMLAFTISVQKPIFSLRMYDLNNSNHSYDKCREVDWFLTAKKQKTKRNFSLALVMFYVCNIPSESIFTSYEMFVF